MKDYTVYIALSYAGVILSFLILWLFSSHQLKTLIRLFKKNGRLNS